MSVMAKKKPSGGGKKRPPSRDNTKYLAVPKAYYEALQVYARNRSDKDTKRSVSWAARVALRRFLEAEKLLPTGDEPPAD